MNINSPLLPTEQVFDVLSRLHRRVEELKLELTVDTARPRTKRKASENVEEDENGNPSFNADSQPVTSKQNQKNNADIYCEVEEIHDDLKTLTKLLGYSVPCRTFPPKTHLINRRKCARNRTDDDASSDGSVYGIPCRKGSVCHKNEIHQDVLIDVHSKLMKDLYLGNSEFVDQLFEAKVLSQSDVETIMSEKTCKHRNRQLLLRLGSFGKKSFDIFLGSLKKNSSHLYDVVHDAIRRRQSEQSSSKTPGCILCKMAKDVIVDDVVDHLYEKRIIDINDIQNICKESNKRKSWSIIFRSVKQAQSMGVHVLKESLKPKYPNIAQAIDCDSSDILNCVCSHTCHSKDVSREESPFSEMTYDNIKCKENTEEYREGDEHSCHFFDDTDDEHKDFVENLSTPTQQGIAAEDEKGFWSCREGEENKFRTPNSNTFENIETIQTVTSFFNCQSNADTEETLKKETIHRNTNTSALLTEENDGYMEIENYYAELTTNDTAQRSTITNHLGERESQYYNLYQSENKSDDESESQESEYEVFEGENVHFEKSFTRNSSENTTDGETGFRANSDDARESVQEYRNKPKRPNKMPYFETVVLNSLTKKFEIREHETEDCRYTNCIYSHKEEETDCKRTQIMDDNMNVGPLSDTVDYLGEAYDESHGGKEISENENTTPESALYHKWPTVCSDPGVLENPTYFDERSVQNDTPSLFLNPGNHVDNPNGSLKRSGFSRKAIKRKCSQK